MRWTIIDILQPNAFLVLQNKLFFIAWRWYQWELLPNRKYKKYLPIHAHVIRWLWQNTSLTSGKLHVDKPSNVQWLVVHFALILLGTTLYYLQVWYFNLTNRTSISIGNMITYYHIFIKVMAQSVIEPQCILFMFSIGDNMKVYKYNTSL